MTKAASKDAAFFFSPQALGLNYQNWPEAAFERWREGSKNMAIILPHFHPVV
jgi:hypothetical protein